MKSTFKVLFLLEKQKGCPVRNNLSIFFIVDASTSDATTSLKPIAIFNL